MYFSFKINTIIESIKNEREEIRKERDEIKSERKNDNTNK